MGRLLGLELTRLRWRRAVVVLLAACVLVPAAIWVAVAVETRPLTDADVQRAEDQVQAELQQPYLRDEIERCTEDPQMYGADPDDVEASCRSMLEPRVEWYLTRQPLDLANEREESGIGVITILAALAMLLGTTFVGHDWNSGSMSNQLLFEPRRSRVWLAKALAVLLCGLVVGAAVLASYWTGAWLLAGARDVQASGEQWALIRNQNLRGMLLIGLAGLAGYALTMLFRSTVATLGILFAFTVGGSIVISSVLGEAAARWLPSTNFLAILQNGTEFFNGSTEGQACTEQADGTMSCTNMETLTLAQGSVYLGVVLVVIMAASVWSFQRRDVP